MDHVIQSFTQPLLFLPRLDPTARAILRLDKQLLPRISSRVPGRPLSRTLTYCLRPFFWFTLIKETKVKDHVKWRIPLGAQWVVSACLAPAPPVSMTRLWSRESPRSGADSVFLWWHLASYCPLFTIYHGYGISIFCPTKIKRRWFLITEGTIWESNLAAQSKSGDTKNIWLSLVSHLTKSHQNEETDSQRKRLVWVKLRNAEPGLLFATKCLISASFCCFLI